MMMMIKHREKYSLQGWKMKMASKNLGFGFVKPFKTSKSRI